MFWTGEQIADWFSPRTKSAVTVQQQTEGKPTAIGQGTCGRA